MAPKDKYTMSDIDGVDSKELLWLRFWCQAFSPIIFTMEKCVHFDIWKGPYDLAHYSKFQPNQDLKPEANHIGGYFEKVKKIQNIKMQKFFHHKNDGGKCLAPKLMPKQLFTIHPIHIRHPVYCICIGISHRMRYINVQYYIKYSNTIKNQ